MIHRVKLTVLTCATLLAAACAHAAPSGNLCPAGTKTAQLIQDSGIPGLPIAPPPETGAYGETTVQKWDISQATGGGFQVQCNPNAEGFAGQKVFDVPANSKSCQFDETSGIFSCIQ